VTVWNSVYDSRGSRSIRRQFERRAIPSTWLLLGPRGSGKRSVALAMAAALNCEVAPSVGCGTCNSCRRIARGRHPDVHHIAPEGPIIPVDLIREVVIPEASRSPFEAQYKVFIIEEAERMNPFAQNALLKTLEEPQDDTIFIAITDRDEELLDTIRSRCRDVRLDPVPQARIVELLVAEGASNEQAQLAARLSDGDVDAARDLALDTARIERRWLWRGIPGRLRNPQSAFEAAWEVLAEAKDAVKAREQAQKSEVTELAEAMGEGRGTATARNALAKRHKRELRRLEEEVLGEALTALASFYRDVLVTRRGSDAIANLDMRDDLERWARGGPVEAALLEAIERCAEARGALLRNANPSLTIEAALVELTRLVPPPEVVPSTW
jgi:DNA polymerase-3 subunit delta'